MQTRCSPRLPEWDYTRAAATFVTFCTRDRGDSLGIVNDDEVLLNHLGRRCVAALASIPEHANASVDCSIVMPDHVHAILLAHDDGVDIRAIVGSVKAQVSRNARISGLWQRSFYDHVIRNDTDLDRIREYITTNPMRWTISRREAHVAGGTGPAPTNPTSTIT